MANMACVPAVFLALVVAVCSADKVPVLMWSPSRSLNDLPATHAGSTVDGLSFLDKYLTPLVSKDGNLVLFLQDKLSLEDFSKYADVYNLDSEGGAFKNVKSLMEEHFSLDLPSVRDAHSTLDKLRSQFEGAVHTVSSPEEVAKLDLPKKFLLMVQLPPTAGKEEEAALASNDMMVKKIAHQLQKRNVQYTALYTAMSAEHKTNSARSGRHLMALEGVDNSTTSLFVNVSGTGYLYLKGLEAGIYKSAERSSGFRLIVANVSQTADKKVAANNRTASFELKYSNVTTNSTSDSSKYSITVKFAATKLQMDWVMENLTIAVVNESASSPVVNEMDQILVDMKIPRLYSYHCNNITFTAPANKNITSWQADLSFIGFQFQPFDVELTQGMFADSWDCRGFFTNGIWMGLFPLLLLIIITLWGVYMMMGLSTMDRFDDPKGKTITVNVQE